MIHKNSILNKLFYIIFLVLFVFSSINTASASVDLMNSTFENGSVADWTYQAGAQPYLESVIVKSGLYSMKLNGTTNNKLTFKLINTDYLKKFNVSMDIYLSGFVNTSDERYLYFANASGAIAPSLYMDFTKNATDINIRNASFATMKVASTGQWYNLRYEIFDNGTSLNYNLYIDDVFVGSSVTNGGLVYDVRYLIFSQFAAEIDDILYVDNIRVWTDEAPDSMTSDDFNGGVLNTSIWHFYDPVGDVTQTMTGEQLSINLPATNHDLSTGSLNSPRLIQYVNNTNFQIETKINNLNISAAYKGGGIIVETNSLNLLRFDIFSTATDKNIYTGKIIGGTINTVVNNGLIRNGINGTPNYIRVTRYNDNWTEYYSFDGQNWYQSTRFYFVTNVTAVGIFADNSNTNPEYTALFDYFHVNYLGVDTQAPNITIFYGDNQKFGQLGRPQTDVNILGRMSDYSGNYSLNYSLNGGDYSDLMFGNTIHDRLEYDGDFNADINYTNLSCGTNNITIKAVDILGQTNTSIVNFTYTCGVTWTLPYSINWYNTTNIQDVAQTVDGQWSISNGKINSHIMGYDRIIDLGDVSWNNYSVTVPITLNEELDNSGAYGSNFGITIGWQGHWVWDAEQPKIGWRPVGAFAWYQWNSTLGGMELGLFNGWTTIGRNITTTLSPGHTYVFKVIINQTGTTNSSMNYKMKVWERGTPEPDYYIAQGNGYSLGTQGGSILLNAYYANVSFGRILVTNSTETNNLYDYAYGNVTDGNSVALNNTNVSTSAGYTLTGSNGAYLFNYIFIDGQTYNFTFSKNSYDSVSAPILFNGDFIQINANLTLTPIIPVRSSNLSTTCGNIANFSYTTLVLIGLSLIILGFSLILIILRSSGFNSVLLLSSLIITDIIVIIIGFSMIFLGNYLLSSIYTVLC